MLVVEYEYSTDEYTFVSSEGIVETNRCFDSKEGEKQVGPVAMLGLVQFFKPGTISHRLLKCLWVQLHRPFIFKIPLIQQHKYQGNYKKSTDLQKKTDSCCYRRTPTSVTIHPVALFSILDHYLRRKDDQERVIGTLLGVRSTTDSLEVEVKSSFAVLHSETSEQVAVDMEYHRTMYELHHKVNPKEVIVGW